MKQHFWLYLTHRKMIWFLLFVMIGFLFLFPSVTEAAGWVQENIGGKDAMFNFEKYPLDNYNLDFYINTDWTWLPWNWAEGISATVIYAIFAITNIFWMLNVYLCYFIGFLAQEAFELDFISDLVSSLGETVQTIAGVNKQGIMSTGLVPLFGFLLISLAGVSVAYQALIKQRMTQALQQVIVFLFTFICCGVFFMNAGTYLEKVTNVQQEINTEMLEITKGLLPEDSKADSPTKAIRENLFSIQVDEPWKVLQFGDSDTEKIGEERINALLKNSPYAESGARNEQVKTEVDDKKNGNLSAQKVYLRFGMVFLVLVANIVIGFSVIVLVILLISSQVLFLLYVGFLPVAMIFSLFPGSSRILGAILQKVFQLLFTKMGVTLILTIVFSISHELNALTKDKGYIWSSFLQITLWYSAATRVNELLGFMRIGGETRAANRTGRFLRGMVLGGLSRRFIRGTVGGLTGGLGGAALATMAASKTASIRRVSSSGVPFMERVGRRVSAVGELPRNVTSKMDQMKRFVQYAPTNSQYKGREMHQDYLAGRMHEEARQGRMRQAAQQRQQNLYEARRGVLEDDRKAKERKVAGEMARSAKRDHVIKGQLRKRESAIIPVDPSNNKKEKSKRTLNERNQRSSAQVKSDSAIQTIENAPVETSTKLGKQSGVGTKAKTFVFDRQLTKRAERLSDKKRIKEEKKK